MELILNVAWFVIAAASYALLAWRFASRGTERARGSIRCQCIVALSCALAISFPVISLTDDLHEMQATFVELSSSRTVMKKYGANHRLTPVCTPHQMTYVVSSFGADVGWVAFGNTATQRKVHLSPVLLLTTLGRAPPPLFATQIS